MSDVIVVENRVDMQCMRHLHLMSNLEFGRNILRTYGAPNGIATQEIGVWHFRAVYPYRGALDIACVGIEKKFRRLVVWSLQDYASVQVALRDARQEYCRLFGGEPQYAFMSKLPGGIESGHEFGEMTLLQAEWMLERCVAVGGRG